MFTALIVSLGYLCFKDPRIEAASFKSRMVYNALMFVLSALFHLLTASTNFHTAPAFLWLGDPFQ